MLWFNILMIIRNIVIQNHEDILKFILIFQVIFQQYIQLIDLIIIYFILLIVMGLIDRDK